MESVKNIVKSKNSEMEEVKKALATPDDLAEGEALSAYTNSVSEGIERYDFTRFLV